MFNKTMSFFAALAALMVFTQTPVFADTYTNYTLSGAMFNDGSSFSGSWTMNWTTNTLTALNLTHGAGSYAGPSGGPLAATLFNLSKTPSVWDLTSSGAPGVWEIQILSTDNSQHLHLDFYKDTGVIYAGNASLGTNLGIFPSGGYVSFYNGGNVGTSDAAPTPEPGTIFLLGSGLLGMMGFARKRMSGALTSRPMV